MADLHALIPDASAAWREIPALADVEADRLAATVLHPKEPWWRRRCCAKALDGRVPTDHVDALEALVHDETLESELRGAVLLALASRPRDARRDRLRDHLRHLGRQPKLPWGMDVAVLEAWSRLADPEAVPLLARLAHDPWTGRRELGLRCLARVREDLGDAGVLAGLGVRSVGALRTCPEVAYRRLALLLEPDDVVWALADPDPSIAKLALPRLTTWTLRQHVQVAPAGTPEWRATLWALVGLEAAGKDVLEPWMALEDATVVVDGLPPDVRQAVLREHAPGERGTDPRWILEARVMPGPEADEEALLAAAVAAIASLGPGEPLSAGAYHRQGGGTYSVVPVPDGDVRVSTLGPFATGHPAASPLLEAAGFRWIDETLGKLVVPGLCVYFFGSRDPLSVADLLFYWQD